VALSAVTAILTSVILVVSYRNSKHRQRLQHAHISNLEKGKEIVTLQHIIAGEEQERSRLARELHDGIMVLFSAIKMKLRQLPRSHSSLSNDEEFTSLNEELEQAIRELRRTAHNLMPDMLLDGGLTEAVFYFCRSLQQNSPLHINFQQYGVLPRLREDAELSIYRIVQELVQNIIRHSRANKALVQFNYRNEILGVTVEDNGRGFDHRKTNHTGIGLKSIETRLKALSGTMDIRSNEAGTTIYMEFYLHSIIKSSNIAKTRY
jgi:signal transduction histidine kinase